MFTIIVALTSAIGGVLISTLAGFLTVYINNKHSFRMVKEKDKYEYEKYTNRMLYKYLEELEVNCYVTNFADSRKTFNHVADISETVQQLYTLTKPFLDGDALNKLDALSDNARKSKRVIYERGLSAPDKAKITYEANELNEWYDCASNFRNSLVDCIQEALRQIKNNRK